MTPVEKDKQRRLAIMGAARLKFRDNRIALTELGNLVELKALTGRWHRAYNPLDSNHVIATEESKVYWRGANLTEAEQAVRS